MKHKHADLIKAWADGAEIEGKGGISGQWYAVAAPQWHESMEYRIKPEPKPDIVQYQLQTNSGGYTTWYPSLDDWNGRLKGHDVIGVIKRVIDGETGLLKSAEVLK